MAKYNYDIFISYSHRNEDWVRDVLLPKLEKAKLKVFIDYRDFEIGESGPDAMERAAIKSKQTIIVLSPAYLKSGWTKFENLMVQVMDPANLKRRLIPVLLEECKIPLRLGTFTYANFANPKDVDLEWQKLFKALKVPVPKVSTGKAVTKSPISVNSSSWHLAHPYPMPPNFTGRATELKMLDDWIADDKDRLFILRALGGFGKSALSWQWINTHVNPAEWPKLVWWSFYEGDTSFEHFIEETLKYLKLEIPQGQRPQVDALLKAMQGQKILLIMDGFERALRAYSSMNAAYQGDEEPKLEDNQLDCVNINAEIFLKRVCSLPSIKSKVLMTTRLTPRAVKPRGECSQGCHEAELTAMPKADAVEFFHKQKIKGTHAEIETACALYGYHPLSLRLLAGRILKDFENPSDIVVAQKLKIDGDIKQHQHHVLEVSYNSLPPHEQKLLSTIACFRSTVGLKTLQSIAEDKDTLDNDLHDLVERGLLHFDDKNKKFDLHPIVRRYAYERLTVFDRTTMHSHLRDYFAAVDVPEQPQTLDDLAPVIELYHHTIRTGNYDEAYSMYHDRLRSALYYRFGAYELDLQLLFAVPRLESGLPRLSMPSDQTGNLLYAAMCYERIGRLQSGLDLLEQAIGLNRIIGDKLNLASSQVPFAMLSCDIGNLKTAHISISESVEILDTIEKSNWQPISHRSYGRFLMLCGMFEEAEREFYIVESMYNPKNSYQHGLSVLYIYKAQSYLWQMKPQEAFECAQQAHEFSAQDSLARESIIADWLIGNSLINLFSQRSTDKKLTVTKIESILADVLMRCRCINLVELEPEILLSWANWYRKVGNAHDALKYAQEALHIAGRCEYRLKQADILNFLAQYALEQEKDKAKATEYAETAKKLAYCDDGPPYYYKVAYEEAERLLEKIGKS